jgi:small GTP-binding protein
VDFKIRTIEIEGKYVKLQIWDTAGQERFRTITSSYYAKADGYVLVFDLTDQASFSNIVHWCKELERYASPESLPHKVLVGNNCDQVAKRIVDHDHAKDMADRMHCSYLEASPKNGTNVEEVFAGLATRIMHAKMNGELPNLRSKTTKNARSAVDVQDELVLKSQNLPQKPLTSPAVARKNSKCTIQ